MRHGNMEEAKFYLLRDERILLEGAMGVSASELRRRGGSREEEAGVASISSPKCEVKGAIASLGYNSRHRSLAAETKTKQMKKKLLP